MQESSLHKALKELYADPGGEQEVEIGGFWVDVVIGNNIVEIQTSNFSALKPKLSTLLENHKLCLVHPIPKEKWILKLPKKGETSISRRKSPKRGRVEDLFTQLVYIANFVIHKNLSLEVLLTHQEEIRRDDGLGSWRRKGVSVIDHRLIGIFEKITFQSRWDYQIFVPSALPNPFTTKDLAQLLKIRHRLAGKMIYTLRSLGLVSCAGKAGRAWLYKRME